MIRSGKSSDPGESGSGWLKLPIETLVSWARLRDISFHDVEVKTTGPKGSAVFATKDIIDQDPEPLMTIPREMVLSLEGVYNFAKSDQHLQEVLGALGDYGRTSRGAILVFLLMQCTIACPDIEEKIGVSNGWSDYVKYIPLTPLPSEWTDEERLLLTGTSLEAATNAKVKSLSREFENLRSCTESIPWCKKCWWDAKTGLLSLDDWKQVDSMYRSRALQLPGTGDSMVPCLDMANHASGEETIAAYETDGDGNAVLLLRDGKHLRPGDEVNITYGDEKGACEMLFSYGFIEDTMKNARELFLQLDIPDDDPLKPAKQAVCKTPPGFRLFIREGKTKWESEFIWLVCVNEEDGLEFKVLQTNDGGRELQAFWKGSDLEDITSLKSLLEAEPLWDIFQLRALALLQDRVETQLRRLYETEDAIREARAQLPISSQAWNQATRLRDLEWELLSQAYREFEEEKTLLAGSPTVREFLGLDAGDKADDEDFS
ncbi:SET domain-containing protein [Xylona heveae TC161]|uniref:SET domain-containing protein n=1 Tax=Xylona heveae (strain CBS 132557 / TC161) TaxID=1328760 RepID=A0A165HKL5_XYLHT|nr:SET domain-containing protein [Xylona heveae TC161]KZF23653.1 SET domain-containing protein [Xylona heveae TC161]